MKKRLCGLLEEGKDLRSKVNIVLGTLTAFVIVVVTFGGVGIGILSMMECIDLLGMLASWLIQVMIGSYLSVATHGDVSLDMMSL